MIWYDAMTAEPVAPGACEDAGAPSIEGYDCVNCKNYVMPDWDEQDIMVDDTLFRRVGYGICPKCGFIMLTTMQGA